MTDLARDMIAKGGGASAVGRALGVSKQAVLKWGKKNTIPTDRLPSLKEHIAKIGGNRPVTNVVAMPGAGLPSQGHRSGPARAARREDMAATRIAKRDLDMAKKHADAAEKAAGGLPPVMPLSASYWLLLAMIAAIEIPVMSGSILSFSKVLPITAYCSAAGAVIFLIAGTHIIGGPLREFGDRMPRWIPSIANLLAWGITITGLSFLALDLRATGMEADQIAAASGNMMFPTNQAAQGRVPPSVATMDALLRISGAVMIAGTLLAIVLSYVRHGPQAAFAQAERAYRKAMHAMERIER